MNLRINPAVAKACPAIGPERALDHPFHAPGRLPETPAGFLVSPKPSRSSPEAGEVNASTATKPCRRTGERKFEELAHDFGLRT
jgi:hypothetical protein